MDQAEHGLSKAKHGPSAVDVIIQSPTAQLMLVIYRLSSRCQTKTAGAPFPIAAPVKPHNDRMSYSDTLQLVTKTIGSSDRQQLHVTSQNIQKLI